MKRYYEFAGVEIEVITPDTDKEINERMLGAFAVESVNNPYRFEFELVDEMKAPEGTPVGVFPNYRIYGNVNRWIRYIGSVQKSWEDAHARVVQKNKSYQVQLKRDIYRDHFGIKTVLNTIAAEQLILNAGGFILHASFIKWNGKAILFSAPSETGKSTQAELWKSLRGAQIINGDRAVVREINGKWFACGLPFAGSSTYCENETLPLEAIVYLGQAKETKIQKWKGLMAFRNLWEQIIVPLWDKEAVEQISGKLERVVSEIPIYYLECTPDESAVIALETVIRKDEANGR